MVGDVRGNGTRQTTGKKERPNRGSAESRPRVGPKRRCNMVDKSAMVGLGLYLEQISDLVNILSDNIRTVVHIVVVGRVTVLT